MIDTHCHLNFDSYTPDRAAVLQRARDADVTRIIIPGVDLKACREGVALAAVERGIFAAVGIHPNSTADVTDAMLDEVRALSAQPNVVAIGEIGLDYYWDKSPKAQQIEMFEAQLALATELELPVIIHNREASEDTMAVLENWARALPPALRERPGVLHSFSAPASIAERALKIGLYLGFTGPITYKNADDLRRIAATVPLDRILVETDGPFLTPVPHRGQRNEPAYIPIIVERLATLKTIPMQEMAEATTQNAERLFRLPPQ
ncbi:MAG: TatD family hydrolase [bacterium]|nr:TatD family hydrolase [bacterium]